MRAGPPIRSALLTAAKQSQTSFSTRTDSKRRFARSRSGQQQPSEFIREHRGQTRFRAASNPLCIRRLDNATLYLSPKREYNNNNNEHRKKTVPLPGVPPLPPHYHLQEGVDLHVRSRKPRLFVAGEAVRLDGPPLCRDDGREDGCDDEGHEV